MNQINKTNQINQTDQTNQIDRFCSSRGKTVFSKRDRAHHLGIFLLILEGPASNHGHLRAFRVLVVRGLGVLVEIGMNRAGETPNRAAS